MTKYTKKLVSLGVLTTWKEIDYKRIVGGVRSWYKVNTDKLSEIMGASAKVVKKALEKAVEMGKKFNLKSSVERQPTIQLSV